MNFNLSDSAKEKILIVAHRGASGGNIPCNTIAAYEIALKQGADMIETDVEMSTDGVLHIFHPGMEPHHLCHNESIRSLTAEEISRLRYVNYDNTPTQFAIPTFDEFLETFKGRCYINVDKFWGHPKEIYGAIKRHGMQEQILVKSNPTPDVIGVLRELAPTLPYMPIVTDTHPMHAALMKSGINYIGAEVLFYNESVEVASTAFIDKMHRDGKLVWANAIIYNYKKQIAAAHSDDTSLTENPDTGWGWLAKRGFDLIQTDWPLMLRLYLEESGLLYKNK